MANKLLLQILVKARPGIQRGVLKMQDVVSEYFQQTGGKTIDAGDRAIIENEFIEFAPSNVSTPDAFKGFLNEGEIKSPVGENIPKDKINYSAMEDKLSTKLRGNETFDELLEIEKNKSAAAEGGIGSMFPQKTGNMVEDMGRDDWAQFIRNMKSKEIQNPDIRKLVKNTGGDIAEGKRSATTLARAADMGADTKIKQSILSDLDADKLERGPKWWKGDEVGGPMGRDDFSAFSEDIVGTVNNSIMDDIDLLVGEEKTNEMWRWISQKRKDYKNDPKTFVRFLKNELAENNIKYDMTFWENYVDEIMQLTTAEVPMFRTGGLV